MSWFYKRRREKLAKKKPKTTIGRARMKNAHEKGNIGLGLPKAAMEFDEEKKRERNRLIANLDYIKEEALFAYDTGGEVVTRRDNEFGVRVIIKHRDIGHKLFTTNLQPEDKEEEVDDEE